MEFFYKRDPQRGCSLWSDTIVVLISDKVRPKIRIAGNDAPEEHQPKEASDLQALAAAVLRRAIVLDQHKCDPYGHLVAKVLLADRDLGLEHVAAGLASRKKVY